VDDNNFYQYDREKSDVYILGMIILEISNLAPLKYFEPKTKRFHFEIINSVFNQFKEKYSPKLYEIVNRMLTADYNIRPSFEEIIENIEEKTFHTNSNISSKDSTIINDANKEYS
jgi:serine/threonine protein kinase